MDREMTYAEALNQALREEMIADPGVFLIGEDIGRYGGSFKVTRGLIDEFGPGRVIDSPLSESAIVGACVGAALAGLRPVAEIMFSDFLTIAMDQIVNNAAKMCYLYGGAMPVPLVIRTPCGGGTGTGAHHSQSLEAWFMHVPGLKVAMPSTPSDAYGLLRSSIRDNNPVLFFEPRILYRTKGMVSLSKGPIPLGKAEVRRKGDDITLVTFGSMVPKSLTAAEALAVEGIAVEVIDLRTLVPLDEETLLESVRKTQRLVVVEEGCKTGGVGAEVAAVVAEKAIYSLDAPIKRIAAPDIPIPASRRLEDFVLPSEDTIAAGVREAVKECC